MTTHESAIQAGRIVAGMNFHEKVWAITARIPRGKVTTYAAIARKLGGSAYRAVGNAMNCNPYAPMVPCHRVVGSDRRLVGFAGGLPRKAKMLTDEGVTITGNRVDTKHVIRELK
jgi:methylated-DNA-[protein]-cysteine S-methyltransferase